MSTITDLESIGLSAPRQQITGETASDTFLTLMTTQLENQDPLQPMESGEFLSQLAAFETAAGVRSLEEQFLLLSEALYAAQALQASSLLGRRVLAESATGVLSTDGMLEGAVAVPASSTSVVVEIHDEAGQLVRRLDLGTQAAGRAEFTWDGRDESGVAMPPGSYRVSSLVTVDGEPQAATTLIASEVESVTLSDAGGQIVLNLVGGLEVPFSQVNEIM